MDDWQEQRRYRVSFEFIHRPRDVLTVWATDPDGGVEAARNWLDFSQRYPAGEASKICIDLLGDESDPRDLAVAETNEDVSHRRFSA